MIIIISILTIIYYFFKNNIYTLIFKLNKNKICKKLINETQYPQHIKNILTIFINVLNNNVSIFSNSKINYNDMLITFNKINKNTNIDNNINEKSVATFVRNKTLNQNKIECFIHTWLNDTFKQLNYQFILNESDFGTDFITYDINEYKIMIKMNIFKCDISYKEIE